jgi:hypothetical protein
MKKYFIYCSMLITLFGWQVFAENPKADDWGAISNNLQMSIRLDGKENQIKAGQSFNLLIRYKNISTNETFIFYEVNGTINDRTYSFIVTSPSGKDVSPDMTKIQPSFSGVFRGISSGQIVEIKFNLSKFCSLDEIGAYKITVKKEKILQPAQNKEFAIISNPLSVVVVPNDH